MFKIAVPLSLIAGAVGLLYLLRRTHELEAERDQLAVDLRDARSARIVTASELDEFLGHTPRRPLWVYRENSAVPCGPFDSFVDAERTAESQAAQHPGAAVHLLASVGNCLSMSPEPQWEWSGGQYLD